MKENKTNRTGRDPSLDIIRCFAFMLVVTVHFFLRSGIYDVPVDSLRMFLVCTIRSFCVACVPLFILLTGYLQKNKKPEAAYFVKLIPVLTVYVICALANIAFNNYYGMWHDGPVQVVLKVLNFKGARYAWYVEMYIALFLFSPYLNLIWNGLENVHQRRVLIGIMIFVSIAPSILNVWRVASPDWWLMPSAVRKYDKLIPAWWKNLYPVTYYLIGCYLAEYRVRMKRGKCIGWIAFWTVFAGAFNFWRSRPGTFYSAAWSNYASPFTCMIAVLLFIFFLSGNYEGMSDRKKRFFSSWAAVTFGAYLLSNIPDTVIYVRLANMVPDPAKRFIWILITVPFSAVTSCIGAWIINLAADPVSAKLMAMALRITEKRKKRSGGKEEASL